jgi:hypothetical protein
LIMDKPNRLYCGRKPVTAALAIAALAVALAACGSTNPAASHAKPPSTPPVAVATSAPPSWCTAAFARAGNGSTPAALEPWLRDSPVIRALFQQWSFVLAENRLIDHPHSIAWLWNNAPVTTAGLQQAQQDIDKINRICR